MSHYVFICVPTSGHIAPLVAVARELVGRGHRATFVHHFEVAPLLQSYGVDVVAVPAVARAPGVFDAAMERAAQVDGHRGIVGLLRDFAASSALLCEALPQVLRDLGADLIVSDWIEPSSGLVAHHLRLPYVSIAAALPLNWAPGDASPFVGWSYRAGRLHRYGNIAAQWVAEQVQWPIHKVIATYAARWGLPANRRVQDWASGYAQIAQLIPSLDFPRQSLIGCFHYCGPLRAQAPASVGGSRAVRRRAFASLGSLQGHRASVFEWIADATESLGLDLVVAHGGRLAPADAARLSRRAEVHSSIDYMAALRESDIAIMHGGLNGVLDALACGVPLVVVPLAYEQASIAARVRRSGAGRICRPLARRGRLATAIADVLDDPLYAHAAAATREEIATAGGVLRAADIIEQVTRTGAPCLNAAAVEANPDLARHALGAA